MTSTFTPPAPLQTAVLFLVFNRPDTTAKVFEAIRQAKPPRLYVAADGPREGREGEAERVAKVREIATAVDWPCEVKTLFREKNLGCKYAVSGAITWFFEQEEQGIILEDDCLPSQSFFWFCEELLNCYKKDLRVWHISGNNFYSMIKPSIESYTYGGVFGSIWGWATWRSRWSQYDTEITRFEESLKNQLLQSSYGGGHAVRSRLRDFWAIRHGLDTWDYQWVFCRWVNSGMTIIPAVNMVLNIGFGDDATHTKGFPGSNKVRPPEDLQFPITHPKIMIRNAVLEDELVLRRPLWVGAIRKIFRGLGLWVKKLKNLVA